MEMEMLKRERRYGRTEGRDQVYGMMEREGERRESEVRRRAGREGRNK